MNNTDRPFAGPDFVEPDNAWPQVSATPQPPQTHAEPAPILEVPVTAPRAARARATYTEAELGPIVVVASKTVILAVAGWWLLKDNTYITDYVWLSLLRGFISVTVILAAIRTWQAATALHRKKNNQSKGH